MGLCGHGVVEEHASNTYQPIVSQTACCSCLQEFHPYVFQILAQLIELSDPPLGAVSKLGAECVCVWVVCLTACSTAQPP